MSAIPVVFPYQRLEMKVNRSLQRMDGRSRDGRQMRPPPLTSGEHRSPIIEARKQKSAFLSKIGLD